MGNANGRPTNASKQSKNYLREQCQLVESCLNQLEEICKTPNITQKEDYVGSIGLLIGKLCVRFTNIENELGIFDE